MNDTTAASPPIKRWPERLFKLFGLLVILTSLGGGWLIMDYRAALDQPLTMPEAGMTLTVQPGDSLHGIAEALYTQGVLAHPVYLALHGRLENKAGQIKAGEYQLQPGTTPRSLLLILVAGKVTQYSLTIVEGWTFAQLRTALAQHEALRHTLTAASDSEVMAALGKPDLHPEGQFLPDTYHFPRGTTDQAFLLRAHDALQRQLTEAWDKRAKDLPYQNPYDALIMASIIEKETGVPSERPEIAGVFVRRLHKGMRLQTDPTIIYGLGADFDGNLTRAHLNDAGNRYNSYQHDGLPPTPIALPGRAAIKAALSPAPGNSLFFVSRGDGSHQFSATLQEHNRAVRDYQLNGKERAAAKNGAETKTTVPKPATEPAAAETGNAAQTGTVSPGDSDDAR